MNTHSPIKAVIFDLDGTLLYTLPSLVKSGTNLLAALGHEARPAEEYYRYVGGGYRELVRSLLEASGEKDSERFDSACELYRQIFQDCCADEVVPYPGIVELLDKLETRGIPYSVLSNKSDLLLSKVLAKGLPKQHFRQIQGQVDGIPLKPDPTLALRLAADLGLPTEVIAFVGDSDVDMQTAVRAGMIPFGALWGYRSREELETNGANYLLEKPTDLLMHFE